MGKFYHGWAWLARGLLHRSQGFLTRVHHLSIALVTLHGRFQKGLIGRATQLKDLCFQMADIAALA